jgi:two-component system CheB/CheR fusion protein
LPTTKKTVPRKNGSPLRKGLLRASSKKTIPPDALIGQREPQPFLVVGVGASAGGIEAFSQFLRKLPEDVPCAFVFICHLSPDHESTLGRIFERETKIPVHTIVEPMNAEAGHIYVLPPNRQIRIENGVLLPESRQKEDGHHRPIDTFFQSLAIDQGNCAVGILLSGNGNDGSAGIQQIKAEGGLTFAQSSLSAAFPALPGAGLATGCVDFVLPPDRIASEIKRIAHHPILRRIRSGQAASLPDSDTELSRIFSMLRSLNGVDFSYYKPSTIKRRILRRMFLRRTKEMSDYISFLQKNPTELDDLFHDLLINVTAFFRDPQVFTALRRKIYPRIVKQNGSEPVRVWIPGCATGEEVYSIAISLFEFLGKSSGNKSIQVFATDISEPALAKARLGIYPESISKDISPERLRRFFHKIEGGYQIAKFIRDTCVFARQNLVEDPPFSRLDLISCRNVLIYLGPQLQKKVIPVFHYALKPNGHLLLGGSETIGGFADLFSLVDKKHKVYTKRDGIARQEMDFVHHHKSMPQSGPRAAVVRVDDGIPGQDLSRQVDRLLLAQFGPSGVVINGRMEVLQFRGQTHSYLEHPPGEASLNLLKLLRPELLVDVRTLVTRAIKLDTIIRKDQIPFRRNGKDTGLSVEVVPFKNMSQDERYYLVIFTESPADEIAAGTLKKASASQLSQHARREIVHLREELSSTKESLQAIIEEQEATNEELKSANEEIQSSNEELQSTNEELETAKEELQSTNEELTTLNEELQTRNIELNQLNNDLRNLLSSVSMPILMLGNDLTVRRFTPSAERFFNLIPTDMGRRISDINPNIQVGNLSVWVSEVIESLKIQEHEVQDREGRWYSLRIRPYRTTENKIDGVVLMLVDIDEMKRGLDEFMALVQQPLLTLRGDLRVNHANDAFYKSFNLTREATENTLIYDLADGAWNSPALRNLFEGVLPEKNRVDSFRIEHDFGPLGRKTLLVSARRLYQRTKGTQLTLLAITNVQTSSEKHETKR